jgi:RNA polymerase sigma-70 factor (ECF subfamily)
MNSSNDFLREMTAIVPTLRAFGHSLCANRSWADDLVQETMLKAWSGRERFQPGSNMKAWLLTILRNQYYSELRHRKFEVEDPNDELASRIAVQPEHEAASTLAAVAHALKTLPDEQREALLLVCASGLSYRQAAVVCHCAVGTIKSRIARARDHLLEFLGLDEQRTPSFCVSSQQRAHEPCGHATTFKRSAPSPAA